MQQTDQRLRAAFIALVRERRKSAITISEVARRAGVGRSTFYTHFGDLEEMHAQWFKEFTWHGRSGPAVLGFSRAFFEHAHEQRSLWSHQHRRKNGAAIRQRLRQSILALTREAVRQHPAARLAPTKREAVARYLAGAFAELLFWWIDAPVAMPPAEIAALFHQLTEGALSARR